MGFVFAIIFLGQMFYKTVIRKVLVDLCNLMTLRYDPAQQNTSQLRKLTYGDFKGSQEPFPSPTDVEVALRLAIRKTVIESRTQSVSVALSAGIDSTVILSLIRDEFPEIEINCVTVSFDQYTEAKDAKRIAESKSSFFHNVVIDNPLRDLPYLVSIAKEPRWNLYQYYFIEKSKQFSSVLFTGDGGDELFGGYIFRYHKFLSSYHPNLSWIDRTRLYLDCHDRDWVPDQAKMFGPALQFNWNKIYSLFKEYFDNDLHPLDQVFLADYNGKLMYDFVPVNTKFFDHFNLLGIAPLLEHSVVDMSLKIPQSLKYDMKRNMGKLPLRKIASKWDATNLFDKKIGFGMNLYDLWIRVGKEIVNSTLDKARIFEDRLISKDFYNRSLLRIADSHDVRYISKMLQLLSFEVWYRMFVTFDISSNTTL
jgi:asparagine synthase (glutamine-hydrolysing)